MQIFLTALISSAVSAFYLYFIIRKAVRSGINDAANDRINRKAGRNQSPPMSISLLKALDEPLFVKKAEQQIPTLRSEHELVTKSGLRFQRPPKINIDLFSA